MSRRRICCTAFIAVALLWSGCEQRDGKDLIISSSCNLSLITAYKLDIEEPSGLSLSKDGNYLWTVSDSSSGVYRISLTGETSERFQVPYGDLEGITTMDESHFAFIAERSRMIVVASKDGSILAEHKLPISGNDNSGPEALSYDEATEQFHVVRENPGQWLILDRNFQVIREQRLKFAQDYSSVSYDSDKGHLWVMSDLSRSIHVIDANSEIIAAFSLNIDQMEGLAIDHEKQLLYIISDPLAKLFVFRFDLESQ